MGMLSAGPSLKQAEFHRASYRRGIEAAIAIVRERGERIRGAIQPDRTINEIQERLLAGSDFL